MVVGGVAMDHVFESRRSAAARNLRDRADTSARLAERASAGPWPRLDSVWMCRCDRGTAATTPTVTRILRHLENEKVDTSLMAIAAGENDAADRRDRVPGRLRAPQWSGTTARSVALESRDVHLHRDCPCRLRRRPADFRNPTRVLYSTLSLIQRPGDTKRPVTVVTPGPTLRERRTSGHAFTRSTTSSHTAGNCANWPTTPRAD